MPRWYRVVALAVAVVAVNAATEVVTSENQSRGVYPVDGDSISIPILTTLVLSVIFSPWLLLLASFTQFRVVRNCFFAGGIRAALAGVGLVILYAPPIFLAASGIEYWALPHHYAIAATFGIALIVIIGLIWDDFRTLRSNSALLTDTYTSPLRAQRGAAKRGR